jgi:peptide chain release factor
MAQEERSQHLNRRLAMARLAERLEQQAEARRAESRQEQWRSHDELERGNPVRVFRGARFGPAGTKGHG